MVLSVAVALLWFFASTSLATAQETPNPPEPTPAFAGQTDAPAPPRASRYRVTVITDELVGPWSVAFLPDGHFLISESAGRLKTVSPDGKVSEPIAGVPPVKIVAAQGFHDIALDPDFAANRYVYFAYFAPPKGEEPKRWPVEHFYNEVWKKSVAERRALDLGSERIGRAKLSLDNRQLLGVEVLIDGRAERRLAFAPDGTLYATGADAFRFYGNDLDGVDHDFTDEPDVRRNYSGRVIRINRDGSIPLDNPWLGRPTVPRELFAHGLRDPEGAAFNPATGELWTIEHGPQGGDELNIIRAGRDYGWPDVSYGVQYDARQPDGRKNVPVAQGLRSMPGVEEPVYYWVPSIAPSGMAFYTGDLFPDWKGNLFVGALAGQHLVRLVLDGDRVVAEEKLLADREQRVRDVRQGPDGALYVLAGDSLLRLSPR